MSNHAKRTLPSLIAIVGVMVICACCSNATGQLSSHHATPASHRGSAEVPGVSSANGDLTPSAGGAESSTSAPSGSMSPASTPSQTPTTVQGGSTGPSPGTGASSVTTSNPPQGTAPAVTTSCVEAVRATYQPTGNADVSPFSITPTSEVQQVGAACQSQVDLAGSMHDVAGAQYFIYNTWVRDLAQAACRSDSRSKLCDSSS